MNTQTSPVDTSLLGTWKMVSWTRKRVATGEVTDALGPDPVGFISYQPDGHMSAMVVRRNRPRAPGRALTPAEKVELFDGMLAYVGTYTVENGQVVHHVEASWNEAWTGTDLVRPFRLQGDDLTITGAPSKDPATGEDVIYRIVFRRASRLLSAGRP